MKIKIIGLFLMCSALCGCMSVKVRPVEANNDPIKLVYIRLNRQVAVTDFLLVLEDGFQRNGIKTKIITDDTASDSDYVVSYSAKQSWDLAPYLRSAEIRLKKGGKLIASATYHQAGGFDFSKWGSTASKIDPVIDKLLTNPSTK
jgi:hypothetical protein